MKAASRDAVVIISSNADFTAPLAELAAGVLGLACRVETDYAVRPTASLIVTDRLADHACPQLTIGQGIWAKPLKMANLLAEMSVMLAHRSAEETLVFHTHYELQPRHKCMRHLPTGNMIDLTDKEIQLIQCLTLAGTAGASREQLLKDVWGFDLPLDTHTLETHIYRLRGKFRELAGDAAPRIVAIEGTYRLESD